jgi:hypothetical protein
MQARAFHGRSIIFTRLRPISWGFGLVPHPNCTAYRSISNNARQRPNIRASTARTSVQFARGAKTKAQVKLKDLPQGALKLESYSDGSDDAPRYPTVVQGHRNNMEKFKNCVVLTRVGGFYEVSCALNRLAFVYLYLF